MKKFLKVLALGVVVSISSELVFGAEDSVVSPTFNSDYIAQVQSEKIRERVSEEKTNADTQDHEKFLKRLERGRAGR